jgi:hypothetical protein
VEWDLDSLNNFKLPTPSSNDPQFYNIITNIPNYSALGGGITIYTNLNVIIFDTTYENIYVGGLFTQVTQQDGTTLTVSNIAKWNIASQLWDALNNGLNGEVKTLVFKYGILYAGGNINNFVSTWNGSVWTPIGSSLGGPVNSLVFDNNGVLYAGGNFTDYIASWDGTNWTGIGSSLNENVNCLLFNNSNNLYAGGNFTGKISIWNGSTWSNLGEGLNYTVYSLAYDNTNSILYAGGDFSQATQTSGDNINVNKIVQWNENTQLWYKLGKTSVSLASPVYSLVFKNENLYVGTSINDAAIGCFGSYLLKWNGSFFSSVGPAILNISFNGQTSYISSIALDENNDIFCLIDDNGDNNPAFIGNSVIFNVFEITGLQIINCDNTPLDLSQKIYAAQQTQSNLLVYNQTLKKWQIT